MFDLDSSFCDTAVVVQINVTNYARNNVSRLVGLLWNVPNFDCLSRSDHFHLKDDVVEK